MVKSLSHPAAKYVPKASEYNNNILKNVIKLGSVLPRGHALPPDGSYQYYSTLQNTYLLFIVLSIIYFLKINHFGEKSLKTLIQC